MRNVPRKMFLCHIPLSLLELTLIGATRFITHGSVFLLTLESESESLALLILFATAEVRVYPLFSSGNLCLESAASTEIETAKDLSKLNVFFPVL